MNLRNMSLEERIAVTAYAVEANSFESMTLWKEYKYTVDWVDCSSGYTQIVEGGGFVSLLWSVLDGVPVLFYEITSDEVIHSVVEEYIKTNFNLNVLDTASTFHSIIKDIKDRV